MKSNGVSGRAFLSNNSSVRFGLGMTLFACLVALLVLSSSASAASVAQEAQLADVGLVFLNPPARATPSWTGDCSGTTCTATSPCAFPTGYLVEFTGESCVLVFNAGDYANALRQVKTVSGDAQLSIALQNGVSNLNLSLSGSATVNVTSYSYLMSSTLPKTSVTSSIFSFVEVSTLNVYGLSMTDSRFEMSDNSSSTASRDNAAIRVYDSSFDVVSKSAIPSHSAVFDLSLSATPSTRTAGLIFKNSTSTNTGGDMDIYLFQSTSVVTGFVSLQQAAVTGYGSISHVNGASTTYMVYLDCTLTDIGSLQTPTDTSAGMTLNLRSSTVSRSSFANDDAFTLITRGIAISLIESSTLRYASIYCQDDKANQLSMSDFSLLVSDLYDSDLCIISEGTTTSPLLTYATITQSEASASFKHPPNVTFSNVYLGSDHFTFKADTPARTPFVLQGHVSFLTQSTVISNSLALADDSFIAIPWLSLSPGYYHLGSNATLTALPLTSSGYNIWNFTLPVFTDGDSSGTIDFTNVRTNLIVTNTPSALLLGTSKTILKTGNGIPELLLRMRVQWIATEAPNAHSLMKIGSFILPNVTSPQLAYPSGRFGYYDTDPYRFQGSFSPSATNSWLTFNFYISLPQTCPLPGPTFVSSNTTASGIVCNNITGQWIYDGHLNTTNDDLSIPCPGCTLLVLGNFTMGSNEIYLQGVYSVLKAAEHINIAAGAKASALVTLTYDQAPASKWKSDFLQAGFDSPQMASIAVRLDEINKGCKYLTLKSAFKNPIITLSFDTKNDCIIPIAVGVSLGLASLLAIALTIVYCSCCRERAVMKKKGYSDI